ncbi:aldo/keto reductase [Rhizobiaceae bacterium n36]|uniref:Aldo/keto reductase n=2 Tax=Ferirhizobium litorale TaxID=2927786 RepID=A0AAE3QCH1_9HYPH|nr:aldo/keto reductase [Fererhizobium litorale]MDI7923207.1 aldo/keto reductase [Fererhizobium litorale]
MLGAATSLPNLACAAPGPLARTIPSSGEIIPPVGLGTWITFNVGDDAVLRDACADVMDAFFKSGGAMIDSSPMYGSSQPVIGHGLRNIGRPDALFSADKVWTSTGSRGRVQIERSRAYWGVDRFDLLQVHNLLAWEEHLETLNAMKGDGRLRYIGITTSEGRRHDLFEEIMRKEPLDFVQFSYNIVDREAEERLLPLAAERGIAVIVNRPFRQGALTRRLEAETLPGWAADIGAVTWAQVILKFILSHPAVTVVIPATTRVEHVQENLAAASEPLPDRKLRERMATYVQDL